jgi:hypothetical protein
LDAAISKVADACVSERKRQSKMLITAEHCSCVLTALHYTVQRWLRDDTVVVSEE